MLSSAGGALALEPVRITGQEDGLPVSAHALVLEDASRLLDLAQVRSHSEVWRPAPPDALNFGISKSIWWAHLRLANPGAERQPVVLDLGTPLQDYVHWHVLQPDGRVRVDRRSGDRLPFRERFIPYRDLAIHLVLEPHEELDVYLQFDTHDGLFVTMPLRLWEPERFFAAANLETLLLGCYYGALLALALYNLFLFVSVRDRAFGMYVVYLSAFLVWAITFRGFGLQYLWPDSPHLNHRIVAVTATLSFAGSAMFGVSYLRMSERLPRWLLRLNLSLIGLTLAGLPLGLMDYYMLSFAWCLPVGTLMVVGNIGTGVSELLKGSREARFFTVAFGLVGIGVGLYVLRMFGVLPANPFTNYGMQVASAIEVLVLALGLADAMNMLKAQKLRAERAAREAQAALATDLEQQVRERTEALQQANGRLSELAITDELTGAFNRRHFNHVFCNLLDGRIRQEPVALCMFDIDHFKGYNDRYGHQAGDQALQEVAAALQAQLKRSGDRLFRLGGEEFGVLFNARSLHAAHDFVEGLRQAVHQLDRPHAGSASGRLTASFGLAWWEPGELAHLTEEKMYAIADGLLYQAKATGRDRVVSQAGLAVRGFVA